MKSDVGGGAYKSLGGGGRLEQAAPFETYMAGRQRTRYIPLEAIARRFQAGVELTGGPQQRVFQLGRGAARVPLTCIAVGPFAADRHNLCI